MAKCDGHSSLVELPSKKEVIQKVKAEYSDKLYAAKAEIITKDNEAKREEWLLEDLEERALAEEMVIGLVLRT